MSIKYIEATIIRNLENETIFRPFMRFLGYENITKDDDTIILSFDDDSVCDIKEHHIDKKIKFEKSYCNSSGSFPIYFDLNGKTLFKKNPELIDGLKKLHLNNIFMNFEKKDLFSSQKIPSIYNIIYYVDDSSSGSTDFKLEVFGIVRIKSNEEKPRYIIAYNDKYFDKSYVIYLIDCVFKINFGNET
jgi:hypothetical protein